MKKLYLHSFKTGIGTLRLAATDEGLAIISLPGEPRRYFEGKIEKHFADHVVAQGGAVTKAAEKQLKAYLGGRLKKFRLPLDVKGTPFQKKVLRRVQGIPYGSTMSYGDVAKAVGCPRAFRAVGTANGSNSLPLVIPCHRVVAKVGLGGYGGGLKLKRQLLKMEGAL